MRKISALLLLAALPTAAQAQVAPITQTISGTRLDIVVRGESRVVPDIAIISAGVVTNASDAATAMRENAQRMARVIAALAKVGIANRDVQTQSISLQPQYRYQENMPPVITGYQASNNLTIRFRDIGKAGQILDLLVQQGVNQINGPTLTIDQPEAAMDQARMAAVRTLQQRAQLYARATGLRVKRIVILSEAQDFGSPVPVATMARAEMAGDASTKVAAGEQMIGVTLSAVFELE